MQSAGTAGVLFSTFQSAAMGGYGVGGVMAAFASTGAAAGAAAGTGAAAAVKTSNMDSSRTVYMSWSSSDSPALVYQIVGA
jgi:hypothetical protein